MNPMHTSLKVSFMLAWATRTLEGPGVRVAEPTDERRDAILEALARPFEGLSTKCPHTRRRECAPDAIVPVVTSKPTDEERWMSQKVGVQPARLEPPKGSGVRFSLTHSRLRRAFLRSTRPTPPSTTRTSVNPVGHTTAWPSRRCRSPSVSGCRSKRCTRRARCPRVRSVQARMQ